MTADQLRTARAAHWRQNRNPIVTLEDAQSWCERHPLSLFLPRRAQLPAPAPSFVEACLGEANPSPASIAIEQAGEFVVRLVQSGTVIALNLLGAAGEQPDFLAQAEVLPFVYSLRGERDWKQEPSHSSSHKVSPLVLELWRVLEREGPLAAAAAREKLGRELTEAAVLRALSELWQPLRVIPIPQAGGQPALWEPLQLRHRQALATGSATSQVTAISLLVSMYLQSVYAASSDEIEIFLSPLVSRSRIREAVRGLSATRQIQSLSMDAQTYYFLEGGLPEFVSPAETEPAESTRGRRAEWEESRARPAPVPHATAPDAARSLASISDPGAIPGVEVPRPAVKWRGAQPDSTRTGDRRPRSSEKPRWAGKAGKERTPGRAKPAYAKPPYRSRTWAGVPPQNSRTGGPKHSHAPSPAGVGSTQGASARPNRDADSRAGTGWKRNPAAPGSKERWRKFPQKPEAGERPSPGPFRPARPSSPQRGQRFQPARGPRRPNDSGAPPRSPATEAPYRRENRGVPDRRTGMQGFGPPKRRLPESGATHTRSAETKFSPGVERPRTGRPFAGKAASSRPASSKPRSGTPRTGKPWSNKPGFSKSGFSKSGSAKSRFGKPGTGGGKRWDAAPGRSPGARSQPQAGRSGGQGEGKGPAATQGGFSKRRPGGAPGKAPGGFKSAGSKPRSFKERGGKAGGFRSGGFKTRVSGFESRSSSSKFSRPGSSPRKAKTRFRDKNLGKKKPEA